MGEGKFPLSLSIWRWLGAVQWACSSILAGSQWDSHKFHRVMTVLLSLIHTDIQNWYTKLITTRLFIHITDHCQYTNATIPSLLGLSLAKPLNITIFVAFSHSTLLRYNRGPPYLTEPKHGDSLQRPLLIKHTLITYEVGQERKRTTEEGLFL